MEKCTFVPSPELEDIYATDNQAKKIAGELCGEKLKA